MTQHLEQIGASALEEEGQVSWRVPYCHYEDLVCSDEVCCEDGEWGVSWGDEKRVDQNHADYETEDGQHLVCADDVHCENEAW